MRFRVQGVDRTTGRPVKPMIIEAADEQSALSAAAGAGMLVAGVEALPAAPARKSPAPPAPKSPVAPALLAADMRVISSGAVCETYETIGLVVGFASTAQGCGG